MRGQNRRRVYEGRQSYKMSLRGTHNIQEEKTWGGKRDVREGHTVYRQHCIAVQDKDNQIPVEHNDKRAKTLTQSRKERNGDDQENWSRN